jgi:hypothetical protein
VPNPEVSHPWVAAVKTLRKRPFVLRDTHYEDIGKSILAVGPNASAKNA